MCFFDLTGYTRLTEERGDEVAADLARSLASLVQKNSVRYGGKAVKFLGDGVMFHFPDPGKGVLAALDMVEAAVSVGLPPAHVGLHAGPVLFQEGDYFGRTVNITARIADYARPGEVLVSQEVVDASGDLALAFAEIGPVDLKGVSGPVHLHKATAHARLVTRPGHESRLLRKHSVNNGATGGKSPVVRNPPDSRQGKGVLPWPRRRRTF